MSIEDATTFEQFVIGGADRKDDALRFESWRTVNSVGVWRAALRNTDGTYNNTFDIQDQLLVDVNALANTLMQGRVDGPGVVLQGIDAESDWDEYIIVGGYDQAQDLLFHNDLEYLSPVPTQTLSTVINNVINVELAGTTNITYVPIGGTPAVGSVEFRKGSNFLSTTQELFQRANYLFYVNDVLSLRIGAPGFSNSGVTIRSVAGSTSNNVIGNVEFTRRSGDKLYNKIYVYGKSPQFDAYTEYLASRWSSSLAGWTLSDETTEIATITGNTASIRADYTGGGAATQTFMTLDFSDVDQDEVDMSDGEIGFWWRYDGGTSAARACCEIALLDASGNQIYFYSGNSIPGGGVASNVNSTRTYQTVWGWCRAPVGYDVDTGLGAQPDQWYDTDGTSVAGFDWSRVAEIAIRYKDAGGANAPDEMEVDGLRLPFPALALAEDVASQASFRTRPLPIQFPYVRHQLTLEEKAEQLLEHHKNSGIDLIKFTTAGNQSLRYAGQTITVNIPSLGLNGDLFYMTSIHQIVEPYQDVSEGYGFDWVTEVEAIPISSIAYELGRLRDGPIYSAFQLGSNSGVGLRSK